MITDNDVKNIIHTCIKKNKASGIDDISGNVIIENADLFALPLSYLINLSFATGSFPEKLKTALVCPVHKSGENSLPENYRPISLFSCISKIFEKAFIIQLTSYLIRNNILNESQFGFRRGHSTVHALISVIEKIYQAFENREFFLAIYVDLKKACDMIVY